jgi:hypothetical protein
MAQKRDKNGDVDENAHLRGIGAAWVAVARKLDSLDPTRQTRIKSIRINVSLGVQQTYETRYFVILRGAYGGNDVVKFRRLGKMENLPHVLLDMLRHESDWRPDKYGSDGNLE